MSQKWSTLRNSIIAAALCFILSAGGFPAALAQNESLAEAYRIIASKRCVDLAHSFSPLTPVWKGFGPATSLRKDRPRLRASVRLSPPGKFTRSGALFHSRNSFGQRCSTSDWVKPSHSP